MKILSAEFIKSVVGEDPILQNGIPQIAFIGRSNVGKSSTINSLVKRQGLAITSSSPGRTQQINIFLVDNSFYLVDLPGYGFAKLSQKDKKWLFNLINWYLFNQSVEQKKIVLIIDANVGPTADDLEMLWALEERRKDILVVANKVDKIKKSEYNKQIKKISEKIGDHKIIFYSAKTGLGIKELAKEVLI